MVEAGLSLDPTIRRIAQRRQCVAVEAGRLDQALAAYASTTSPAVSGATVSALEHYSMRDTEACSCATCAEWQRRRAEFVAAVRFVPKGHKWSICSCPTCRFIGRIQLNLLAATNRRDLLIEMSFHARYHSRHGEPIMAWLETEMASPRYTVNWCAQEMSHYSVEWWMRRCETAIGVVASGMLFRDSVLADGIPQYQVSTLMVEVNAPHV